MKYINKGLDILYSHCATIVMGTVYPSWTPVFIPGF
jgi:hypothetical protein